MNVFKFLLVYLLAMSAAVAAPGAHGPNGEHLDAPGGHAAGDARPRIEAFTESFELVGYLQNGELSVMIDRYESNEPVLDGKLEVEFNGAKAAARFHADYGDYAVDDENFLKALARPGKHALLFTLTAGAESDLIEGTLEVPENGSGEAHDDNHGRGALLIWAIAGALLAVAAVAAFVIAARFRRKTSPGK